MLATAKQTADETGYQRQSYQQYGKDKNKNETYEM